MGGSIRHLTGNLTQRRDVVEHPEAPAVRGHDQIVFMNRQIAHRGRRQVELQRPPVISVVERNEDGALSAGEQQPASLRVFFDGLHVNAFRQSARDLNPGLACVTRAQNVRLVILELMPFKRRVSFLRIKMRGFDHHYLGP